MPENNEIVNELLTSYWMEIETQQNYLANAVNLDGLRAMEVKEALEEDIDQEITHAKRLARRIHVLGGVVPGSAGFKAAQSSLQPSQDTTDVKQVIKGVLDAENGAIAQYQKIVTMCEGSDYVTQELCIELLGEEEEHRRQFLGFLKEFEGAGSKTGKAV